MTIRVGMITPSSNTVVEPVTTALTAGLYPAVSVHYTRIPVTAISLGDASQAQFETETMVAAARLLADAGMGSIVWNGTSGAWRGVGADGEICRAIEAATGVPTTTATVTQIIAFRRWNVRRFGLAVPYLPEVRDRIVETYAGAGHEAVRTALLERPIEVNHEFAEVPRDEIRDLIRRADAPEAEAIAVICTNFPAAWLVDEMERELGKPVFDSTLLAAWGGLQMAGAPSRVPGWGRLFEE